MSRHRSLNHAKFRIRYHLVVATKYRRDCLVGIEQSVKDVFTEIADQSDFDLVEVGVDKNHVHCVVSSPPRLSPLQVVRRLKQVSTRRLWERNYTHLSRFYWGRKQGSIMWSGGYFCETIGPVQESTILNYVKTQGQT